MKWLRLYHDTITDPKWRVVANDSGQPEANVLAVWMHMLVNASASSERGTLEGWNDRVVAAGLGIPAPAVAAIRDAMQGMVLDGMRLTGWDKRQFASDDAGEVKRKQRARGRRNPPDGGGKGGDAAELDIQRANGRTSGHSADVHGQTADVHGQSMDRPCDVQENPLYLSYLPSPSPTLTKKDDDDAGARAREVGGRVAEIAGMDPRKVRAGRVEAWLAAGYDPERDIYPAVRYCVGRAQEPIGSFRYFDREIARHHAERTAPPAVPSNVRYLPRAAGGRRMTADDAAACDLLSDLRASGYEQLLGVPR